MREKEWFGEWFNSPYYHTLYRSRDHEEARFFLDNLISYLNPPTRASFLDVGCGTGRHSIYLTINGFNVTGIDLSQQNIKEASKHKNDRLHFFQHDMREPFREKAFDYVLNLFTSFGYFSTKEEHKKTIATMAWNLKEGGRLILDFLNPYTVINHLVKEEVKTIDGIKFHIHRHFDGEFIVKKIEFSNHGKNYRFFEKVNAIRRVEFLEYFEAAGLKMNRLIGGYDLRDYHKTSSERLIMIAEK